jgi:hypothetical protein
MSKLVVIACRLPHGLLLELGQQGAENYQSIKINGIHSVDSSGKPSSLVVNGHAFTQVPEAFWNDWRKAHQGAPYLKNRMVFAEDTLDAAHRATTLAESKGKTGFEPLSPDAPPSDIVVDAEALKAARAGSQSLMQ